MTNDARRRARPTTSIRGTIAFIIALLAASLLAACSEEEATFADGSFAVVANADIGTGISRLLVGVVSEDGERLGGPEDDVRLALEPTDGSGAVREVDATWTWILEPAVGLWRAQVDLPLAGPWQVTVLPATGDAPRPAVFVATADTLAPNVGEPAPAPATPTTDDLPLEALTTDPDPDPDFYRSSLDDVITRGDPSVVVFATPAYCTTVACGPLLNVAKSVAGDYPDIEFIHVEVYTGFDQPGFIPGVDSLSPAVGPAYWSLPSEPWVFVINDQGIVAARFEGVMASDELRLALDSL